MPVPKILSSILVLSINPAEVNSSIFGTGKFYKEKQDDKKGDIYSNIDEMLSRTLKSDDQE